MSEIKTSFICYNHGCGQSFYPHDNKEDSCQYHPGYPVFHDAYKGWSCCNKKCTDFSEFLNIKGCTKSYHSKDKPPITPKSMIIKDKQYFNPLIATHSLQRPPFDFPQVLLKPKITPIFLEQIEKLTVSEILKKKEKTEDKIMVGESCKHNTCKSIYNDEISKDEICMYHPGTAVFHEGIKYWSCCKKMTTDFNVFLEQPGCLQGNHMWIEKDAKKKINCRMDWHQTEKYVIVSVFAKKYNPNLSYIKLNPIHLTIDIFFPEDNSSYNLDMELKGIANVESSYVIMSPTKIEIKIKKREPGSWDTLEIPKNIGTSKCENLFAKDNVLQENPTKFSNI